MLALSVTTGLVDAVSVLGLGRVFSANMTGNVIFLAIAIIGLPGFTPLRYVVAIVGFEAGAVIGGRIASLAIKVPVRQWLIWAALLESSLLWAAALIAMPHDFQGARPEAAVYTIIALTAVAMGFRNATVRRLAIPDVTTTVLTLTLAGLAADSWLAGGSNRNWGRRVSSAAAMFAGAAAGAFLIVYAGLGGTLLLAGAVVLGATLACGLARP